MRDVADVKKNVEELLTEEFGIRPDVRVFAFGGGAGRIASYLAERKIEGTRIIAVNADEKGLSQVNADKKMILGKDVLGEHSDTNGEVKVGEYIINRNRAWLLEEARQADVIVLIAALGGGMGTGGILETARVFKENLEKPMVAITILPFSVEGERRTLALKAVEELREMTTKTVVLDSDALVKTAPNVGVLKAYERLYESVWEFVGKVANITRRAIERKFREMYLTDVETIVEDVYHQVLLPA